MNKINMLYLTFEEIKDGNGISQKILSQVEAFKKNNRNVLLIKNKKMNNKFYRCSEDENIVFDKSFENKLGRRFLCYKFSNILEYIKNNNIKEVYIRYVQINNIFFINFLKKLKKLNIIMLLEIPTYPYDGENIHNSFIKKISSLSEKYFRKKLFKYVDRIITFSEDDEIFRIKTIKISNGINSSLMNKKFKNKINTTNNEINCIGVATLVFYHGYDRFIYGLANYYKNNADALNVKFHIVGEGNLSLMNHLKQIVESESLQDKVIFHGTKFGKELENLYNKANIGIGSLARHRSNITTMRALKNREYCAMGLPMIFSEDDPDFRNISFAYKISQDEVPVEIQELINWYQSLKFNKEEIQEFSKQFSWDIQIRKVVNEIECLHNN